MHFPLVLTAPSHSLTVESLVAAGAAARVRVAAAALLADAVDLFGRMMRIVVPHILGVLRPFLGGLMHLDLVLDRRVLLVGARRDRGALAVVAVSARDILIHVVVIVHSLLRHK